MNKINFKQLFALLIITGLIASGCSSMNKTQKGVLIGAGAGGAVGAGVGKAAGNTALGAIIGAAVGGATGGVIGRKMDKQAEEMAKIPGAEVKRVGEGINVTFESGVLFAVDQATLNSDAQTKIKDLAAILAKNPDTYILIEGHTDNSGTSSHNMTLSERRAKAVSDFLSAQSVASSRLKTAWYGESQPKVANDSESNRAQNRRVEFAIYANEKLVQQAKEEAAKG
jgi:outer membrane protein OmpA-like peptidoglycan-associated protein